MKILHLSSIALAAITLTACTAGVNGTRVSTGQCYFSPYAPSMENTAVVYIYWNQGDIERYIPFGERQPAWETSINGKKNAELEEGSFSVVEVEEGRVRIQARPKLGSGITDLSSRNPHINLNAEAGESYFISARMDRVVSGDLELRFDRILSEREAYDYLYGLECQENLQDTMLY